MNRKERRVQNKVGLTAGHAAPAAAQVAFADAVQHHRAGRLSEAEGGYRRVLAADPRHAESLHQLGVLASRRGAYDAAADLIGKAVAIAAHIASYHDSLGTVLQGQGRLDEAIVCHRRAIELQPDFAAAYYNLGRALHRQERLDEAIAAYRKAVALQANFAEAHTNLGSTLQALGRPGEAVACFRHVLALRPNLPEAHYNLGTALQEDGKPEEATFAYKRAVELRPDFAEAYYNLGGALDEQGRLEEAYAAYERAAQLQPRRGAFYRTLANTGRIGPASPHLPRMEALARDIGSLSETDQMELHFALGTVYRDHAQHEQSFRHLLAGNRGKRRRIAYDEAATLTLFDRVRSVFTAELLAVDRVVGEASPLPIFVVGMPRSGTTLVEQILATHPRVFGAGELPDLPWSVSALEVATGAAFPEVFAHLPDERLAELGRAYRERLRLYAQTATRIVDKLPGNFMRIGLIRMALPEARIIHIRRDPIDTCLSCFSTLFTSGLPYAYDLAELGRYYRAYERLMKHWRQVLPAGIMLEVRYEELVNDLPGQARAMLDHCGLTWDERCLAFHQNRRVVRTASATQVRQPLYQSSVGRWQIFRDLARPLVDALTM